MVQKDDCAGHCPDHSGFRADIRNLKEDCGSMSKKIDDISGKFNTILGGLVIALIMLVVNIALTVGKSGASLP